MANLEPCNREIYEHGEVLFMKHMPSIDAESLVGSLRKQHPELDIDWHYVAGRAVFKALRKDRKINNVRLRAENALRVFKNYNRLHEASPGYDKMQDAMQELEDALKGK